MSASSGQPEQNKDKWLKRCSPSYANGGSVVLQWLCFAEKQHQHWQREAKQAEAAADCCQAQCRSKYCGSALKDLEVRGIDEACPQALQLRMVHLKHILKLN